MNELPKVYNPKEVEEKWYKYWEGHHFFSAKPNSEKKPYTIVIPPPNVTGILHMGHALNNTIQDILIRYKRMQGFETLWLPGTDHAGIATQNVVEKELAKENKKRQDLGREEFLKRVWKWKEQYGSTIVKQLRKLGCSCDWSRERFTMDEGLSDAVLEVFIKLYKKGLIYRGNYIINWCPRCHTALSDEEAQHRDVEGVLYYIKYPVEGSGDDHVIVATTRPETMLGDVAVAVNPKDNRYKHLKGKTVILPILNRKLKIICDSVVDMKFGTGALKVTPAHDPTDFELGRKHKLVPINVMNGDATMNELAGEDYRGMDRLECREKLIEDLKRRKLLLKTEQHRHAVGHCYRCNSMVEPRLSEQWFVSMKPLAKAAIKVVKTNKLKFYPKRWTKIYLDWMENIRDWCISRQIWWGHRIPVYYCNDCQKEKAGKGIIVQKTLPGKCPKCSSNNITQDPDVLDTWFSSWLWPFSTLGWPKQTDDLSYFYPTNTLVTAQEIIFFWVARMVMAGYEFMKKTPFSDVYIHGTVRDLTGTKMSKSLGNVIDPLEIINEFGADALRVSLISLTGVGGDLFLSQEKFHIGRNFANKIWNASRLVLGNLDRDKLKPDLCVFYQKSKLELKERWILSRLYNTLKKVSSSLDNYRINDAAKIIYEFFWHEFCDWYLEFAKPTMDHEDTQMVLYKTLEKTLRMLHPIMPFITEEIWQRLPHEGESIMLSTWPHTQEQIIDSKAELDMKVLIDVITSVRNARSVWHIDSGSQIDILLKCKDAHTRKVIKDNELYLKRLAKVKDLKIADQIKKPKHSATSLAGEIEIFVPLEGIIDFEKEKKNLTKRLDETERILKGITSKLKNKDFLKKAPKDVVNKEKEKKLELEGTIGRLKKNLEDLK